MNEKNDFLLTFDREITTSLKVLRAFPADKPEFKPHERSMSALELAKTFFLEVKIMRDSLAGVIEFAKYGDRVFANMAEAIAEFESASGKFREAFESANKEVLTKKIKFGPLEMPVMDLIWMMLLDQVHHRGQMSVYIRLADGKVPAIYGPSADENPFAQAQTS